MRPIKIKLSGALVGQPTVLEWQAAEGNILSLLAFLQDQAPTAAHKIIDANGQVRSFVGIYVNGEAIHQQEPDTVLMYPNDEVLIIGSVAGGWP